MPEAVHRIRLRGFWEATSLPDERERYRRAFGRPRTLDPDERAWLVCDRVPGPATVTVNGTPVGSVDVAGPLSFDVTQLLLLRNEVAIETTGEPAEVAMEIRQIAASGG
jgi:hypothetical protein